MSRADQITRGASDSIAVRLGLAAPQPCVDGGDRWIFCLVYTTKIIRFGSFQVVCPHWLATKQLPSLLPSPHQSPRGNEGAHTVPPAGTNEQAIIDVLTQRSNAQRQQIAKSFMAQFGKVKGGTCGRGAVGTTAARDSLAGRALLDEVQLV